MQIRIQKQRGLLLTVIIVSVACIIIVGGIYQRLKLSENIEKSLLKIPNIPLSTPVKNVVPGIAIKPKILIYPEGSLGNLNSYIYIGSIHKNRKADSVDIKINGSMDFYPIEHLSPFTLSWNLKNISGCSLGGGEVVPEDAQSINGNYNVDFIKVGSFGSIRLKGLRLEYKPVLRVVLSCYYDRGKGAEREGVDIGVGIPVIQPIPTAVEFVYPKEGDSVASRIEYGDWGSIKWRVLANPMDLVISSVDFVIHEAYSGEIIYPKEQGKISRFPNQNYQNGIISHNWSYKIPKGYYYLEIEKINNIPVNARSGVFKVKSPTVMSYFRAQWHSLLFMIVSGI